MQRSSYEILETRNDITFIQDLDGPVSVTNDAEKVYAEIQRLRMPTYRTPHRVVYRDTYGEWFEIIGKRMRPDSPYAYGVEFAPWHGEVWDILTK